MNPSTFGSFGAVAAAAALLAAWFGAVLWYGGEGDQVRSLVLILTAAGLAVLGLSLGKRLRLPPLGWWWPLALVIILLPLWQLLPLQIAHPWTATDRALLASEPTVWALDPDSTWRTLAWAIGIAGAALLATLTWRGERCLMLAYWLVGLTAIHAALALPLASLLPEWPTHEFAGRVRGTFVYPNHAADLWGACLPLALALARSERRRRILWFAATVTIATALILSASRGGILCAALVSAPFAWHALPHRRRWWWAGGAAALLATWLVALNLDTVTTRFASLTGEQGASLSGRLNIWETAWPHIRDTWLLGAGPGSEPLVFLRGGSEVFGDLEVDRLHSDSLEWLTCYGVVGLGALIAALAWALLHWALAYRRSARQEHEAGKRERLVAGGALGGLVLLLLHCQGEFTWHSPAIACTGVLLAVIACGCLHASLPRDERSSRRTLPVRGALFAAALLVGWAAWIEWPLADDDARAWHGRTVAGERQADDLPVDHADAVQQLLREPAGSVVAATAQAEVAWVAAPDGGNRELMERDLRFLGSRSPAQPMAWALRGRLALLAGDRAALATALDRLRVWAPAWGPTRSLELAVLLSPDAAVIDDERKRVALRGALNSRGLQGMPRELIDLAGELLGEAECDMLLEDAQPTVAAAGLPWLAEHGSRDSWLAVATRLAPEKFSPVAWLAAQALGLPDQTRYPSDASDRHALLRYLGTVRLPAPPALLAAVQADGPPGAFEPALWLAPGADPTPEWLTARAAAGAGLRVWLHQEAARASWEDCREAGELLAGHSNSLNNSDWPPLIALAVQLVQDPAEHNRLLGVAASARLSGWEYLPDDAGISRWWDAGRGWPTVRVDTWAGVAVDGVWLGWQRGTISFAQARWTSGVHRIQLLTAPAP